MKRIFLITLLLCLYAQSAWAAISIVNTPTVFNTTSGGATQTYTFQCNATTDFLVVGIASYGDHNGGGTSGLTSAAYNGATMTVTAHYGLGSEDVHILTLVAPTTGSSVNLVMNYSPSNSFGLVAQALCLKGVNQAAPTGNINGVGDTSGTASPISTSISMTSGSWAFAVAATATSGTLTATGGATEISNNTWGGQKMAFSYLLDATAMGWTYTGGTIRFSRGVIEISEAATASPNPFPRRRSQ